jgi:hypothetical protein
MAFGKLKCIWKDNIKMEIGPKWLVLEGAD